MGEFPFQTDEASGRSNNFDFPVLPCKGKLVLSASFYPQTYGYLKKFHIEFHFGNLYSTFIFFNLNI